jgi:hypothetical protein
VESGLILKLVFIFTDTTHEPLHLDKLGWGIPTSIIPIIILFDETLKYSDDAKLLGYVGTNSVQNTVILCNVIT